MSQESEAGGCEVFWAENTSELTTGIWYTARIEMSDASVTLCINDEVVLTSDSVKHTGFGRLGFFTNNASMYVDDVDCTFKHGDIPQDGLISYVIEPDKYSNYIEIESTDDGQTLIGVGTTKKMSTDAGTTWKDITSDSDWSGLKTGDYPTPPNCMMALTYKLCRMRILLYILRMICKNGHYMNNQWFLRMKYRIAKVENWQSCM